MAEPAPFGTGGFATTRVFRAPRERVWREWTKPERFADWFGGVECEIPVARLSSRDSTSGSHPERRRGRGER